LRRPSLLIGGVSVADAPVRNRNRMVKAWDCPN
jgi:hypothetical protein